MTDRRPYDRERERDLRKPRAARVRRVLLAAERPVFWAGSLASIAALAIYLF